MRAGAIQIPDAGVLRRASDALRAASAVALDERVVELPLIFGKRAAIEAQNRRLDAGIAHAREAVELLADAGHPVLVQARAGAADLGAHLEAWQGLRGRTRAFHGFGETPTYMGKNTGIDSYRKYQTVQQHGDQLAFAADGIEGIDAGRGPAWLADVTMGANRFHQAFGGLRLVVDARPGTFDPLLEALVPHADLRGVGDERMMANAIQALLHSVPSNRGEVVDQIWRHMVEFGNGTSDFGGRRTDGLGNTIDTRTRVAVVKAMYDEASAHRLGAAATRPTWLDGLDDDALVSLDFVSRTQLDLLTRATTRADVERIVVERLTAPDRMRYNALDTGAGTYAAAMELPEQLRPRLHDTVVHDLTKLRARLYEVWKSTMDGRLADGVRPAAVVAEMLADPHVVFPRANLYRDALATLDRVAVDGAGAKLVSNTRELLETNLGWTTGARSGGYARHPDYAVHGRALANAQLLARMDQLTTTPRPTPDAPVETLTW